MQLSTTTILPGCIITKTRNALPIVLYYKPLCTPYTTLFIAIAVACFYYNCPCPAIMPCAAIHRERYRTSVLYLHTRQEPLRAALYVLDVHVAILQLTILRELDIDSPVSTIMHVREASLDQVAGAELTCTYIHVRVCKIAASSVSVFAYYQPTVSCFRGGHVNRTAYYTPGT